jgi:hypothetical protein
MSPKVCATLWNGDQLSSVEAVFASHQTACMGCCHRNVIVSSDHFLNQAYFFLVLQVRVVAAAAAATAQTVVVGTRELACVDPSEQAALVGLESVRKVRRHHHWLGSVLRSHLDLSVAVFGRLCIFDLSERTVTRWRMLLLS